MGHYRTNDENSGGLEKSTSFANVESFPNPANGISASLSKDAIKKVTLYNSLGQQVAIFLGNVMNLEKIPQGVYSMKIDYADTSLQNAFAKLIVQRQ